MVSGIRTGTAQKAKTWPAYPDRPPKILESVTNKGPTRMLNNTDNPIFSTWCTFQSISKSNKFEMAGSFFDWAT